jgi:hypothetical protein
LRQGNAVADRLPYNPLQALRVLAEMPNTSQDDIDTLLVTLLDDKKVPLSDAKCRTYIIAGGDTLW